MKDKCCNQDCNQGRDCPVRAGTHKPADAVHQIQEPAVLPQWLLNKIGAYGGAIRSGDGEVEIIHHWTELIAAIKQYAAPVQTAPAMAAALFAARGALQHMKEGGKPTQSLLNEAIAAIDSVAVTQAAPAAVAVPDGWKLVPELPTQDMCESAKYGIDARLSVFKWADGYKAMLASAPECAALAATPAVVNASETPNSSTIAIPRGWKLVPDDATPEWIENLEALPDWREAVGECIKKFLAAAPAAPQAAHATVAVPDELNMDAVLSMADVHAVESLADGVRHFDRGGLYALAKDIARAALAATPAAEPVVLPEPAGRTTSHDGEFYWDNHLVGHESRFGAKLYTEQQVRALLATGGQAQADKEMQLAMQEASSLAQSIFKRHYSDDEHYASGSVVWGLCDSLRGVISQIDNMTSGLVRAPQAQAVERIAIDMKQTAELLDLFGGEATEFTVMQCNGHSGPGLYAYVTEYPEDGASFLGKTDSDATPTSQAQAGAREFPAMTPELASILGLMCFQCIPFAQALRTAGHQIKTRAEDEQAAVLHWMLGHWFRHGEEWRDHAQADMNRMKDAAIAAAKGDA